LVAIISVGLIKFILISSNNSAAGWAAPLVFLSAAAIPTLIRKKSLRGIGFQLVQPKQLLWNLFVVSLIVFPFLFGGVLLLRYCNLPLPMGPAIPIKKWFVWILYQFLFVATSEETFFRGYLQSNLQHLLTTAVKTKLELSQWYSIIICAMFFAGAHVVILGNVTSIVTFFPGLVFGWLFVRTRSLLTPVLFHGLANVVYGFFVMMVT
jgi:membrane protease YdiL (CAAX protease family)